MCYFNTSSVTHVGDAAVEIITCCGLHARPFDPTLSHDAHGNVIWSLPLQDMWTALQKTWTEVAATGDTPTVLPKLKDKGHLISDARGASYLIAIGTESLNPEETAAGRAAAATGATLTTSMRRVRQGRRRDQPHQEPYGCAFASI